MIERPSHAKPHPRDSERTRARILQAAIELFSSGSYDMVRSRDIADKQVSTLLLSIAILAQRKHCSLLHLMSLPRCARIWTLRMPNNSSVTTSPNASTTKTGRIPQLPCVWWPFLLHAPRLLRCCKNSSQMKSAD